MRNYLFRSSKKIYFLIITLVGLALLIGTSAALFIPTIKNNGNSNVANIITLTYGTAKVSYDGNNSQINPGKIDLPTVAVQTDQVYILKFQIENTGELPNYVTINWKNLINTFCQYRDNNFACVDPSTTGTNVADELSYALYQCTSTQYDSATTSSITGTKISALVDVAVPTSGNTGNIHASDYITLPGNSTQYFVLKIILKNLTTNQNYQIGKTFNTSIEINNFNNPIREFAYQNMPYYYTIPVDGQYLIEAWGAQGDGPTHNGGLGGYVKSIVTLTTGQELTINVGGQTGYNGGGASVNSTSYAGGGASTVAINSNYLVIAGGGGATGGAGGLGTAGGNDSGLGGVARYRGTAGNNGLNGGGGSSSTSGKQACGETCNGYEQGECVVWITKFCSIGGLPGKGGSNYVDANATTITNSFGVREADGYIIISPV